MKKILMFQDYFYNGGIEKVILDVKDNINKKYSIDILSIVNKSNNGIISLTNNDYRSFMKRFLLGIKKYQKYIKNNNYDIIHIHCYNSFGLIYAFVSKKYCEKVIVHAHNNGIDRDFLYIRHIINYIIKLLFNNKKYTYIAVSKEAGKFCFNNKNTIILPNSINYKLYGLNNKERIVYREKYNIKDNEIVIGHIGRFEKQKNHAFIIDIFKEMCLINDNYRLILIGDGLLLKKIKDKVHDLELEDKVVFLSNRNDISKLINMFDIYLFPSIYEGFGITVLENEVNGKYVFISDKITNDVIVSNRVNTIPISCNANYWANKIINLKKVDLKIDNKLELINYIHRIEDIYDKIT